MKNGKVTKKKSCRMKDKEILHFNVYKAASTLLSSAENGKNFPLCFMFVQKSTWKVKQKNSFNIKAFSKRKKTNFNCAKMLASFFGCKRKKLTFQCLHWHWSNNNSFHSHTKLT